MRTLDDTAVVRRVGSDKTHAAIIGGVWRARMIGRNYWAPVLGAQAACGVNIPPTGVIMATGAKTRCRACVHLTGITEQSPSVHERLGAA